MEVLIELLDVLESPAELGLLVPQLKALHRIADGRALVTAAGADRRGAGTERRSELRPRPAIGPRERVRGEAERIVDVGILFHGRLGAGLCQEVPDRKGIFIRPMHSAMPGT